MATAIEIEGKDGIAQSSTEPGFNASSTAWNDEEKVFSSAGHDSIGHDGYNAHDSQTIETQSLAGSQLPPPPDGGLHAWLKVFGGFLVYINIWYDIRVAHSRAAITNLIGALHLPMAHSNPTTRSPSFPTNHRLQFHGSVLSRVGC